MSFLPNRPAPRRASFDAFKHTGSEQFGYLVEASPLTEDDISPYTKSEIERTLLLHTRDPDLRAKMLRSYYRDLRKTDRLHLRNRHRKWVTVTLEHARFLKKIGCRIDGVAHVVLYASLTQASHSEHPYRKTIQQMLAKREDLQREMAAIKELKEPTAADSRRADLCKALIYLTKIRWVSEILGPT